MKIFKASEYDHDNPSAEFIVLNNKELNASGMVTVCLVDNFGQADQPLALAELSPETVNDAQEIGEIETWR